MISLILKKTLGPYQNIFKEQHYSIHPQKGVKACDSNLILSEGYAHIIFKCVNNSRFSSFTSHYPSIVTFLTYCALYKRAATMLMLFTYFIV